MRESLPTVRVHAPPQEQIEFMARWLAEHEAVACGCNAVVTGAETAPQPDAVRLTGIAGRPYEECLSKGQVRLLSPSLASLSRPLFFVLLSDWDEGEWLIAPFGPYSVPALPGELYLPELEDVNLAVLCLWNARTLDARRVAKSWVETKLTSDQLGMAWAVVQHVATGAAIRPDLLPRTGPPVPRRTDPRIAYRKAEMGLLDRVGRMAWPTDEDATDRDAPSKPHVVYAERLFRDYVPQQAAADSGEAVTPCALVRPCAGGAETSGQDLLGYFDARCLAFDPLIPNDRNPVCCEWTIEAGREAIPAGARAAVYDGSTGQCIGPAVLDARPDALFVALTEHGLRSGDKPVLNAARLRIVIEAAL